MNIFLSVILGTFMLLFFATAVLTLLALVKFGQEQKPLVAMPDYYLRRLFAALLLEIVTLGLGVVAFTVQQLRESTEDIGDTATRLEELSEFLATTTSWLNEPSGLTAAGLVGSAGTQGPYALAVDDEEPEIYVIENVQDHLRVRRAIPIAGERPEDFESITWDGNKLYYAATSFRQLGKEGETSRRIIRFEIDPKKWIGADYKIRADGRDFSEKLGEFLQSEGIDVDFERWKKRQEPTEGWHPWEIEIEGLTTIGDKLFIGLKWPLASENKAILLSYDWELDEFSQLNTLDLNGKGISDLSYDSRRGLLIVVANPPEKELKGNEDDQRRYLGESTVYIFDWSAGSLEPRFLNKVPAAARTRAKLEGIAIIGADLWLAYDGPNYGLIRRDISLLDLPGS